MAAEETRILHKIGDFGANIGRSAPRRRGTKLALQIGVPLLILAALTYVVASQWSSLPDYDWHFSLGWLLVSAVGMISFYTGGAFTWLLVVRLMGEELSPIKAQAIFAKSMLARYVPGNMLLILTRVVMAEREGISRKTSLTSVVYEMAITLCSAVAIGSYFLVTLPSLEGSVLRWAILAVVPLILIFLHPRLFRPVTDWALSKLGREPLPAVLGFGSVLLLLICYSLIWSLIGLGSFGFIKAVYPIGAGDLPAVTAAYAISWMFAVMTFVSPSGLGTRDAAYAAALHTVLPTPVAAAIAIGSRLMQTAVELLWAAQALLLERFRR